MNIVKNEHTANVSACDMSDEMAKLEKLRGYVTSGKYSKKQICTMMNLGTIAYMSKTYQLVTMYPGIVLRVLEDEQKTKPLVVTKNGGISLPAKLIEQKCKENQFVAGATLSIEVDCDTIMIKVVAAPACEQDTDQQAKCVKKKSGKKIAVEAKPEEDDKTKDVNEDSLNQEETSKMAQIISIFGEDVINKLKNLDSKTLTSIIETNTQSVAMTA